MTTRYVIVAALVLLAARPAGAQQIAFEKSFDVRPGATLDVATLNGKIDVTVGAAGRIVVNGAATVRTGWDVPANAVELARRVAGNPPIAQEGNRLRLRTPTDAAERRAVTVSYKVQVPPDTTVVSSSQSGATTIRGVAGAVSVHTQSAAIEVGSLGGAVEISSGSGAVTVDGVGGDLAVKTSSGAFTAQSLKGGLTLRTSSGSVDATFIGNGAVDVETGSSGIRLRGVRAGLKTVTQSGRTTVDGVPGAAWDLTSGSGSVEISVPKAARFSVDAETRSGSVKITGGSVQGTSEKRRVKGTLGGDGPLARIKSRSGSITIAVE